jgi:RNA polymerase primary sigma factor
MTDAEFLTSLARLPRLDAEHERRLALRALAGDVGARRRLVEANLRLVAHLARQMPREGTLLSLGDLVQEGAIGLATAAGRYDPGVGPRFGTFARWYVIDALRAAAARGRTGVRLPVAAHRRLRELQRAERRLGAELRRAPAAAELAAALDVPVAEVDDLRRVASGPVSLDAPAPGQEDGASLGALLAAAEDLPAGAPVDPGALRAAVRGLPARERRVIALRYGLDGDPPCTQAEIGRAMHAGERRVAAVERQALRRLRATVAA